MPGRWPAPTPAALGYPGDMGGVNGDAHGGDLEVIADPGQQMEPFFLGDLFG